ncbi:hypothetical protein [Streptomyces sp. NPDC016172]|uniref:hypothetical protein n=1 Tax=Streptomyces sp. NPDC016172 TaxID=3364964 RepID=UPI0036FDECF6
MIGARNERPLADNLAATTWSLTPEERVALDEVSASPLPYPYWHQDYCDADRVKEPEGERPVSGVTRSSGMNGCRE